MKRSLVCGFLSVLAVIVLSPTLFAQESRPNVVMIVVDDLRFDEFGAGGHDFLETPNIDRLAAEGAMFSSAYHATPLCSPNRASLLTGQYASRHGIVDNTSRSYASHRLALFARDLQAAGYRTAHVGKWHMGNDPTPRPGYDYWVSFAGQGKTNDPEIFEDGTTHQVEGYITDIFTDRGVQFIEQNSDQPFFLYIGHKAVHPEAVQFDDGRVDLSKGRRFIPAKRHADRYDGKTIERRPNYGFSDLETVTKPVIRQALEMKHSPEIEEAFADFLDHGISEDTVRRRAEMVLAVDDGVGRILDTLKELGILENTLVIFTSDNGYFYGEHGLSIERRLPYEESLRTPLLMRLPKLVKAGHRPDGMVLSIDLAPTVLDLAGIEIPKHIQGLSLIPMLSGESEKVRTVAYMEYFSHENPFPWTVNLDYRIIRMGKYKYIQWIRFDGQAELYDLEADPYEQQNLIDNPKMKNVISELEQHLQVMSVEALGLSE
jgi:N-acetylglucosamine-6-sulfatase